MTWVYVTARGKVWHERKDCEWLAHAKQNAQRVGRTVHPTRKVWKETLRRTRGGCRVCSG